MSIGNVDDGKKPEKQNEWQILQDYGSTHTPYLEIVPQIFLFVSHHLLFFSFGGLYFL
jgi:hypothetical protein